MSGFYEDCWLVCSFAVWWETGGGGEALPRGPWSPVPVSIPVADGGWLPEWPLRTSKLLRRLDPMVEVLFVPMLLIVLGLPQPRVVVKA